MRLDRYVMCEPMKNKQPFFIRFATTRPYTNRNLSISVRNFLVLFVCLFPKRFDSFLLFSFTLESWNKLWTTASHQPKNSTQRFTATHKLYVIKTQENFMQHHKIVLRTHNFSFVLCSAPFDSRLVWRLYGDLFDFFETVDFCLMSLFLVTNSQANRKIHFHLYESETRNLQWWSLKRHKSAQEVFFGCCCI